jgi:hypothetical protein
MAVAMAMAGRAGRGTRTLVYEWHGPTLKSGSGAPALLCLTRPRSLTPYLGLALRPRFRVQGRDRAGPELNCREPSIPNGRLRLPPRPPYQHPTILLHNTTPVKIGAACLSFIQSYNSLHSMQFGGWLL